MLVPGDRSDASGAGDTPERRYARERRCPMRGMQGMQGMQGMRPLEAIFGLVAAIYGCAVTVVIGAAISSGTLPADKPGALFFQAEGFTAFLALGPGSALHSADKPTPPENSGEH